jgi:hypothetical protein
MSFQPILMIAIKKQELLAKKITICQLKNIYLKLSGLKKRIL